MPGIYINESRLVYSFKMEKKKEKFVFVSIIIIIIPSQYII
jgi:hypothetical protein